MQIYPVRFWRKGQPESMKHVRVYPRLDALPDSYHELFKQLEHQSSLFLSFPWFQNLFHTSVGKEHSVQLFGVEDDASGIAYALLPMCSLRSGQAGFKPRKLSAASNFYASFFAVIQDDAASDWQENLDLLLTFLKSQRPSFDSIDLHPMARESQQFGALECQFRATGMAVQTYFCFGNWYLSVKGRSFQEYFDTLPSRLKNTIGKKKRQLEKGSKTFQITLFQDEEKLPAAIAAYEQVYQSSWKPPETHPLFIAGLIQTCARQGWLRLGIAYIEGQPVAAQLWIVRAGVASIYKLAYAEKFAGLSIGSLLTSHMMQYVIDIDQVEEVDYLTGDDAYKRDWMSGRRERWGMIAFNLHTVSGWLNAAWHLGRRRIKNGMAAIRQTRNMNISDGNDV